MLVLSISLIVISIALSITASSQNLRSGNIELDSFINTYTSPYLKGRYYESLVEINIGNHTTPNEDAEVHIFIVTPNITTGISVTTQLYAPTFYFWTAFAGKVPSVFYTELFNHIASHGIIGKNLEIF